MEEKNYTIEIVQKFKTKKEAFAFEQSEIQRLSPEANSIFNKIELKPCGHRLEEAHFTKIRKVARRLKLKEAEALRKIIEKTEL